MLPGVDASVGGGRGDHGTNEQGCILVGDGGRLESGARGCGEQRLLRRLPAREHGLALLVVLVGLVGEAADQRQPAELDGTGRERPAGSRAEQDGSEAAQRCAGAELVVGDQVADLLHQLLRRLAGGAPERIARVSGGAGGIIDAARTLAHALRRLSQYLAEDVGNAAALLLQLAQDIAEASALAAKHIAQHVLEAACSTRCAPRCLWGRAGIGAKTVHGAAADPGPGQQVAAGILGLGTPAHGRLAG